MNPPIFASFDDLVAFLRRLETSPSDEAGLTELEHLLQCADVLAATAPDDHGLQLAGLLHDIGYTPEREAHHGQIGAEAVRPLVGNRIAELIRLHVDAKRYLISREARYADGLSATSAHTLGLQGGPMTTRELSAFEAHPQAADAIRLRRADDLAKTPGKRTSTLDHWLPALRATIRA